LAFEEAQIEPIRSSRGCIEKTTKHAGLTAGGVLIGTGLGMAIAFGGMRLIPELCCQR